MKIKKHLVLRCFHIEKSGADVNSANGVNFKTGFDFHAGVDCGTDINSVNSVD
jgi:hypothetical protein